MRREIASVSTPQLNGKLCMCLIAKRNRSESSQGSLHFIYSTVHPLLRAEPLRVRPIRVEHGVVDRRESPVLGVRRWCARDRRKFIAFPRGLSASILKYTADNKNLRMIPHVKWSRFWKFISNSGRTNVGRSPYQVIFVVTYGRDERDWHLNQHR